MYTGNHPQTSSPDEDSLYSVENSNPYPGKKKQKQKQKQKQNQKQQNNTNNYTLIQCTQG